MGTRKVFATATAHAKRAGLNYWQYALRDFSEPPVINPRSLERQHFTAGGGGTLAVSATDEVMVLRVCLVLRDANGAVFAFGDGKQRAETNVWEVKFAPPAKAPATPLSLIVTAEGLPHNLAIQGFDLP